ALRPPTPDPQNLKSEIRNPKSDYRLADGAPCPGTERQRALLEEARRSLQEAIDLSETGATLDLVAPPLRACLDALGEITGEVTTAAILDTMFNTFCVGK
ncbi:MAG: hypothetical protein LBD20_05585, partial [Spirochaetaceae bacterium]|nr:hypothetical protein [Spirochaetaceae bacterium]